LLRTVVCDVINRSRVYKLITGVEMIKILTKKTYRKLLEDREMWRASALASADDLAIEAERAIWLKSENDLLRLELSKYKRSRDARGRFVKRAV
jgi:hypothetical protein